jgi:hypothetical protein
MNCLGTTDLTVHMTHCGRRIPDDGVSWLRLHMKVCPLCRTKNSLVIRVVNENFNAVNNRQIIRRNANIIAKARS